MIDFATDKVIIAYYPPGSGGKTVLNCLGLSKNFCLQDINAPLDSLGKFNFIKTRIDQYEIGNKWSDLDLGCLQLYGLDAFKDFNPTFYRTAIYDEKLVELFKSGIYMPIVCHTYSQLKNVLGIFPNSQLIGLTNSFDFSARRNKDTSGTPYDIFNMKRLYNAIKGADWPKVVPKNFSDIPDEIREEILNDFPTFYNALTNTKHYDETFLQDLNKDYEWDVQWFSDVEKTLTEIKSLYNALSLDDFDKEKIRYYYTQWKTKVYDVFMV